MKKYILIFSAILCLALSAQAQVNTKTLLSAGTVTSGATSNYTAAVSLDKVSTFGVQFSFAATGAGSGDVVAAFAYSGDGTNFETTPSLSITNAGNGTTTVVSFNSVTLKPAKEIKLVSIKNSAGADITNVTVKVAQTFTK